VTRTPRALVAAALAFLAVALPGCQSNNDDGRLVGKWRVVSPPGRSPKKGSEEFWEFKPDGTFIMTVRDAGNEEVVNGTYRLGPGDAVYIENLDGSKRYAGKTLSRDLTVTGDSVTLTAPGGATGSLKRAE
jgi:uncharacterized protein (TIGR03066 family)